MNGGARNIFLDTNILVKASVANALEHKEAVKAILDYTQAGYQMWISRQVLREYLATMTRPQLFGGSTLVSQLTVEIKSFEKRFSVAEDNADVTKRLLSLLMQVSAGGKQIHDANIVATMQAYGITHLLTHNIADFLRFSHLITVVPL